MTRTVFLNEEDCIGCGSCEAICPEVFKLMGGKSTVIKPDGGPEDLIEEAMEACPAACISWKE